MVANLLIGGSSNVGKTSAAWLLGRRLGLEVVAVDELPGRRSVGLHRRLGEPGIWRLPPVELLALLHESTRALAPILSEAIQQLARAGHATILEGEGIEPRLLDEIDVADSVTAVFVIETHPGRLRETLLQRESRGGDHFRTLSVAEQTNIVEMNVLYGEWLRDEATERDLPWVTSQPWADLDDRIAAAARRFSPAPE